MFDSLGITERTLAVYRALLEHPELNESALASQMTLSSAEVQDHLERLRKLKLLVPRWTTGETHGQEYAVHPAQGFALLTEQRREQIDELAKELRQDELAARTFSEQYSEVLRRKTVRDTEILDSRERAHQRMQEFQPNQSIWSMAIGRYEGSGPLDESPDLPYLDRGLEYRALYIEANMRTKPGLEFCRWMFEHGAEVRVAPSLPMRLVILDGESAAMPLDPESEPAGAVIHHSKPVLHLAKALYEHYWRSAVELFEGEHRQVAEITPQEAELLNLLVEGATDEQAGRKLGVSLRTVRRMAAKLSEQAGASGRFELGVRAAQRGWVR